VTTLLVEVLFCRVMFVPLAVANERMPVMVPLVEVMEFAKIVAM
jgi:hypothetical protein